jgi:hypothetical protein
MSDNPPSDPKKIKTRIVEQIHSGQVHLTLHAQQEMVADHFSADDLVAALAEGELLENYPNHKRGPCALFNGVTPDQRPIHIVCTTANPVLIVITVYEPKPPKWLTATQRNQ